MLAQIAGNPWRKGPPPKLDQLMALFDFDREACQAQEQTPEEMLLIMQSWNRRLGGEFK